MQLPNFVSRNKVFLYFLLSMFLVRGSLADHMRVPSGSMLPTIEIGDHIFVNKLAYRMNLPFTQIGFDLDAPSPGEVVVFRHPDGGMNLVKRLIAGPGDRLQIRQDGQVFVNGTAIDQPHQAQLGRDDFLYIPSSLGDKQFEIQRIMSGSYDKEVDIRIPDHHFFFLGDNRDYSSDSRSWGLVSKDLLIGRAENVLFSVTFNEYWLPNVQLERVGVDL